MIEKELVNELNSKMDFLIDRFEEYVGRVTSKPIKSKIDNQLEDKVDAAQCAAILKRSLSSIYSKCSSGELKYTKDIGGRLVFSKKYLLSYLENRNVSIRPRTSQDPNTRHSNCP